MLNKKFTTPSFYTWGCLLFFRNILDWKLPINIALPDVAILHVGTLVTTAAVAFDANFANLAVAITLPHGSVCQVYRVPRYLINLIRIIVTGAGQASREYRLNLLTRNTIVVTHNEYLHINNLIIFPLRIYNIFIVMSTLFNFSSTNHDSSIIKYRRLPWCNRLLRFIKYYYNILRIFL